MQLPWVVAWDYIFVDAVVSLFRCFVFSLACILATSSGIGD